MKHRPRPLEQDDLLRPRLVDMIDRRHASVKLAASVDWDVFEREWAGFFPSFKGRPATPPRLAAGLLCQQHACQLSDKAVVARRVENPYDQRRTGETFFRHRPPIDPSSRTRSRGRIWGGRCRMASDPDDPGRAQVRRHRRGQRAARGGGHDGDGKDHRPADGCPALRAGAFSWWRWRRRPGVELRQSCARLAPRAGPGLAPDWPRTGPGLAPGWRCRLAPGWRCRLAPGWPRTGAAGWPRAGAAGWPLRPCQAVQAHAQGIEKAEGPYRPGHA